MIPAIKICGITRAEDLSLCEELGVDFIGLNFVPSSPRYRTKEQALRLRSLVRRVKTVGVFLDAPIDDVLATARDIDLDLVQTHGSESLAYVRALGIPTIKAFRTLPDMGTLLSFIEAGCQILLDGRSSGQKANWESIARLPAEIRCHLFLAGGLTAENVSEAIRRIQPLALDASSGIEITPGIKDPKLLRAFITSIRACTPSLI